MGWTRQTYAAEFKEQVVELVSGGRSVSDVAKDLGISRYVIYYWLRQKDQPTKAKPDISPLEEENQRLHKELEDVKMERDFLKKVMAVFSKNQR